MRASSDWVFRPRRVLFEERALQYELGRRLWERYGGHSPGRGAGGRVEVAVVPSHNRVTGLPGAAPAEAYREAKRTLVVGVRRSLEFAPCRPSADYQLPLVTSCPGLCEYCYLQTTLGRRPYVRVYVNLEEVLAQAGKLALPPPGGPGPPADRPVFFEGAAVGDPVPVEPLTGSLARAVRFFAGLDGARFRFVTKFPSVDGLLGLDHRGRTRVRVTVNVPRVIREFDHGTPGLDVRLDTLRRLGAAGYPVGAMVAPLFLDGKWREEYGELLDRLRPVLAAGGSAPGSSEVAPTLEVVTHRFTPTARRLILERHPESRLPLSDKGRCPRRGRFGHLKYLYPNDLVTEAKEFFARLVGERLPGVRLDYVV